MEIEFKSAQLGSEMAGEGILFVSITRETGRGRVDGPHSIVT